MDLEDPRTRRLDKIFRGIAFIQAITPTDHELQLLAAIQ
jgi:hypothetical protein